MKIYYITFTKENVEKCKNKTKTHTRRVIEKIDHYKNIKPDDILVTRKNRFSKVEVDRNIVVKTWTEKVQDISDNDIKFEGIVAHYNKDVSKILTYKEEWIKLWDSINEKRGYAWKTNPRVRVIEFKQFVSWRDQTATAKPFGEKE